jgi:hypothetical protein
MEVQSYFLNLGGCYVGVVLPHLQPARLQVVHLAFVILGDAVAVAVGAVAALAPEAQQADLLMAAVAARVVLLPGDGGLWYVRHCEVADFLLDGLLLDMLPT